MKRKFLCKMILLWMILCLCPIAKAQFIHPGADHTLADLDRMKEKVLAKEHPWIDGWNQMIADSKAQKTYTADASLTSNRQQAARDATAAYYNFLRWYISGDTEYADCAVRILNAWSSSKNALVTGNSELFQLPMMMLVESAELLRIYPGWKADDITLFKNMCLNSFYPACHKFVGYCGAWPGWDGPANACILSIGIFCDDQAKFDEAVDYYKNGTGGGCVMNMVCQPNGQISEIGRDAPHAEIGPNTAADICQSAWNQGVDLFAYADNRLLKGFEYLSKFYLNHPIEWTPYNDCDNHMFLYPTNKTLNRISQAPAFEIIYNHYVVRKGLSAPYTKAMINLKGIYPITGEYTGYSALTYTLDEALSPFTLKPIPPVPTNVKATAGMSRVVLTWIQPSDDVANGSVIQRSTSPNGIFTTIGTWDYNTSTEYIDESIKNGTTYYYRVAEKNISGQGLFSPIVSATPASGSTTLPEGWIMTDVGTVAAKDSIGFANINNRSFIIKGSGNSFGASVDSHSYLCSNIAGDAILTVRLYNATLAGNNADRIGLIMRESLNEDAKMASIGLADNGFRQVWFTPRTTAGSNASWTGGDTHTWTPVWFRLQRSGNKFTGYQSVDGITWFKIGSTTIAMSSKYYAGLYICSGSSDSKLATKAYIDNVTLSGKTIAVTGTPSEFRGIVVNSNRIKLTWSENAPGTRYAIKRSRSATGLFNTIATDLKDSSYVDSSLVANTTYYYAIKAVSIGGESADSLQTSVLTSEQKIPEAPKGLTATATDGKVSLSWIPVDGIDAYILKRATLIDGLYESLDTVSTLSFDDYAISLGATYYYKIAGLNLLGEGVESSPVSIVISDVQKLTGTHIGTAGSWNNISSTTFEAALDGDLNTYFDANVANGAWAGIDLGRNTRTILNQVRYAPRSTNASRMLYGTFQVATKPNFSDAVTLYTVVTEPATSVLTKQNAVSKNKYRYLRYCSPDNGWGNVAEVEFWGSAINLQNQIITFDSIPTKTTIDADFDPEATASSALTITYSSSNSRVATILNGKIHIVGSGTCTIYANQVGNEVYGTAEQVSRVLKVELPNGISDIQSDKNITISPNPCTDEVTISLDTKFDKVELFDNSGQQVRSESLSGTSYVLKLGDLPSGLYLLKISSGNNFIAKKLVKK